MKSILIRSVDLVPWWLRDRIRKIPVIAGLQQVVFKRFLSGQEFNHEISAGPAKGLVFPVSLPQDKLIWTGTWEKDIAETIAENIREGDVCLDIGSHRGFMAGIMALASKGKVYCFEPNPVNQQHLDSLVRINPKLDFQLMKMAVSDADGEADFAIMPESSMGKLSESVFQSEAGQIDKIKILTRRLDSLVEDRAILPPDFIKIDVEGAELLVLHGASKILTDKRPTLVVELHTCTLAHKCIELLASFGYTTQIIQHGIDLGSEQSFKVCHLLARARD